MGDEGTKDEAIFEWIKGTVRASTPGVKKETFEKAFAKEETVTAIDAFLAGEQPALLFHGDILTVLLEFPTKLPKNKCIYFLNTRPGDKVDPKSFQTQILNGEMCADPLEHLEKTLRDVYLPQLQNKKNQGYGDVVYKETIANLNNFLANVSIIVGHTKGRTYLPLPPLGTQVPDIQNKDLIHHLEGSIVTWTNQIKAVLERSHEDSLKTAMHPTPDEELKFWKSQSANLNSIFSQLKSKQMRQVMIFMDQAKSSYTGPFGSICREVFAARLEANNNVKFLCTMENWFSQLKMVSDFPEMVSLYKPMMHIILLIWKNSKHYNTPACLMVLMRKICNAVIEQARSYVSGEQVFGLISDWEDLRNASEAVEQLKVTIETCRLLKETYMQYKTIANAECPTNPWNIQNSALFSRLDSFLERCHDILDLSQTVVQFSKLAEIEIGGTKGDALTKNAHQMYADFQKAVMMFEGVNYDIMDVNADQFSPDFFKFRSAIKELERRLASLIVQAFEDSPNLKGLFDLLDSVDALLERPNIHDEIEKKFSALLSYFGADLQVVQDLFLSFRDEPTIGCNFPPIAGAIAWCKGLLDRVNNPMTKLFLMDKAIMEAEEAKEVVKQYNNLKISLEEYITQKVGEWGRDVEATAHAKLRLPLLRRDKESKHMSVNFDKQLVRLLREVKYFLLMDLPVPDAAMKVHEKFDFYRKLNNALARVVTVHNSILDTMLPVEEPLVRASLEIVDRTLTKGITKMDWISDGIDEFSEDAKTVVDNTNEIMQTLKQNVGEVETILDSWIASPLLVRNPKPVLVADFNKSHKDHIKECFKMIKDGGSQIHHILKESNKKLKISQNHPDWRAYVDFANNVVTDGLAKVVVTSLDVLLTTVSTPSSDEVNVEEEEDVFGDKPKKPPVLQPLLKIQLNHENNDVVFVPNVFEPDGDEEEDPKKNLRTMVTSWITSILNVGASFRRIDINSGDYRREVVDHEIVRSKLMEINAALDNTESKCNEYKENFTMYSYLWTTPLQETFEKFCAEATEPETATSKSMLNLKTFQEKIRECRELQMKVAEFAPEQDIGWLKVDSRPVKEALESWTGKWTTIFLKHVEKDLQDKLVSLDEFITQANEGMAIPVPDGDTNALTIAMGSIRDVRQENKQTGPMLESGQLTKQLHLLKKFGISIDDISVGSKPILEYLESADVEWHSTIKRMHAKKEEIAPAQNQEMVAVKEELDQFFLRMRSFRNNFRKNAPFEYEVSDENPCSGAYGSLDAFFGEVSSLETEVKRFSEIEELFEIPPRDYVEIQDTLGEMKQLKYLLDNRQLVDNLYADWRTALWADIDTESFDNENKKIIKNLRSFTNSNGVVKAWTLYKDLETRLKDMSVILPLVNDLHSHAMRPRHWQSLAKICGAESIDPDASDFSFDSLLALNLQAHADDVEEVIEIANKELKLDKSLTIIEGVWQRLEILFSQHKNTEIKLIKVPDDIVESLEDHQLQLQTMIGMGKFVDFFRDRVLKWQRTLGDVESVLKEWTSVTKQWASLETIFLASEDIRAQLPEDTKRFEGIDANFKELMRDAEGTPNVAQVCAVEGRAEILQQMTANLQLCQKALNDYLDMKKKIFPRFYFVSNVALLEILSNGNNPPKIMKYLPACYDALANLTFIEGSTKEADSMIAKDGEIVPFPENFEIKRPAVEDWLNDLTAHMQKTCATWMGIGLEAATQWEVEKPRHMWLDDYCAQVVLNGASCITWTEETEASIEEFGGGSEDAIKNHLDLTNKRLKALIGRVLGKLAKPLRQKIISLITLDVHGRDVIAKLIKEKTDDPGNFLWSQQLRFYWEPNNKDTFIKICDYRTTYYYEYVGNTGRLVVTPLTDRCYITLTTAMRLMLGGAPAGPAGTGKTETTKDLGRALALPVYVFNCSPQMNYQTVASIFKGLAQTGSWGCFDEFNRITLEVLSVVATQVKTIQDATVFFAVPANRAEKYQHLPAGQPPTIVGEFIIMEDMITLIPTCGIFITMNPGYAGRAELPENLKVLFRSCAMIRPDLEPICENMLMSEGYSDAPMLAKKFTTLYTLCLALLSPQIHYDWGLRAIKSVLVIGGKLLRASPDLDEECVLMRALRDFNTPKIPNHDLPVFLRLIRDLFPKFAENTPPQFDDDLRDLARQVAVETKLTPHPQLLIKAVQFQELLDVRHSVMLLGPAGCGKTTIWRTLQNAQNVGHQKKIAISEPVNPKAVTNEELFGYMTLAKDWRDGCLSIVMRGMSANDRDLGYYDYQTIKWVVLDDDVDTLWIESMNTVMDANKVLTLVSNERIPLTPAMRMVFEVDSLQNASPATVSRAGILYINESDIGWRPFVDAWIKYMDVNDDVKKILERLTDRYLETGRSTLGKSVSRVIPIKVLAEVQTVTAIIDGIFSAGVNPENLTELQLESYFVYACVWSFGGAMENEEQKKMFHELWTGGYPDIKFPDGGTCFDYFFNHETDEWVHWDTKVEAYDHPGMIGDDCEFFDIIVSTRDSTRLSYLVDLLVTEAKPLMLVGGAGTGKTCTLNNYLLHGADEKYLNATIPMNYFTDSAAVQKQLEAPIDKRSGRRFGPPTGKRLIYFVDDLNLPYIEEYGTQNALSLLRQHLDYESFYDRDDLGLKKEVVDVQYVSAMNPTAGSFTITSRLQRHFSTFTCTMPDASDLSTIYNNIFAGHLDLGGFDSSIVSLAQSLTEATLYLHQQVVIKFLPSAVKFVYNWNMRELDNIYIGLTTMNSAQYGSPLDVYRLWAHECRRVFNDRLIGEADRSTLESILNESASKFLDPKSYKQAEVFEEPLLFTNFITLAAGQPVYVKLDAYETLKDTLDAKLAEYNESNTIMDLVLFKDAMKHCCRIARIVSKARGNALLIGVGGSGKQSLSRLSAYICGLEVKQLAVSSRYGVEDFKEDLRGMFKMAGVKGIPLMFLLTDAQIIDDKFLIYVNDILSNGWIPDLFAKDEVDQCLNGIRNVAKQAGVPDTPITLLAFFIERVRKNLHINLCFSPVGDVFRIRARRFPGLINCTAIDRFLPWPEDALISVANIFLEEVELPTDDLRIQMSKHMAMVHGSVISTSEEYLAAFRRYNYVTPKSFLELIEFYKTLLAQKRTNARQKIDRLDTGLATLAKTEKDVAELKVDLQHTMEKVAEKTVATEKLMATMAVETEEAKIQKDKAAIEEEKSTKASAIAAEIEKSASAELAEAKPAMDAAAQAVDVLSANAITELKGFKAPPDGVMYVCSAIMMMYLGQMNPKKHTWPEAQKMMKDAGKFLAGLKAYDASDMSEELVENLAPIVELPVMAYEVMCKKSFAAANLAAFAVNSFRYNRIYVKVKPLMESLEAAQKSKAAADKALADAQEIVAAVEEKLAALSKQFMEATEESRIVKEQAEKCNAKLNLANRLINGLSSEKLRWGVEVEILRTNEANLVGNVLLSAAFVSYIGAFNAQYRLKLWEQTWKPDIQSRGIPIVETAVPLDQLTDEGINAKMYSEGLPADRISTENGSIINSCKRWPLIIDPQLQGIKWLRGKEGAKEDSTLVVLQLSQNDWPRRIEGAIQNGFTVIIENITSEIDSTLDPVLSRAIYKKGRAYYLKFGGEEIEYDIHFQLYLQTSLPNPHYKPEIAAQCTIVNFTSTEGGLEDQLLARVVNKEKPELEEKKQELIESFNRYKIQLMELENNLLYKLANAPEDILSDIALIEGLEATKKASTEIASAVKLGQETEKEINIAREVYRPAATEASMLYFMLTELNFVNYMYQYSLDAFTFFFYRAIEIAEPAEDQQQRILNLIAKLRFVIFEWVVRGLFEQDKLILMCQLTFLLMIKGRIGDASEPINMRFFQYLLRSPKKIDGDNPLDWLPDGAWHCVCALADEEGFDRLPADMKEASPRFKEWYNQLRPEEEKLPLDWSRLDKYPLQKLLVVRAIRPDRMTMAMRNFVRSELPDGKAYIDCDSTRNSKDVLSECLLQSSPATPVFFILSPGVDVVADVDKCAGEYSMLKNETYHNVSMGQGQDVVAMGKLDVAHKQGHWVILNNIHLMPRWCIELEKKLDQFAVEGSHTKMRVFLTGEPSNGIPIGILSRCIKLSNEPPAGMQANVMRALSSFKADEFNDSEPKVRAILYGLSHFHAIVMERKKFGAMGYNIMYPFGLGDLRDSAICLNNYMESAPSKIPWDDLRYIFGQIIYGGHIVNDNDRLLAMTYLHFYMKDELLDEAELFPFSDGSDRNATLKAPLPTEHANYLKHVDENMKTDTPLIFGLHPNAEIDFRTAASNTLFSSLIELQPKQSGEGDGALSPQAMAEQKIADIQDKISDLSMDVDETIAAIDDRGPYENVFLQEMSMLLLILKEMKRSMAELLLGFGGELSMSDSMEELESSLFMDRIPPRWAKLAWPSLRSLTAWIADLVMRVTQIMEWSGNPNEIPKVTWIGGLLIPESFLTAIKQIGAQRNNLELDKLVTLTEWTKKEKADDIESLAKDGAFMNGFFMQGARYDTGGQTIMPSKPKEMYCQMPIVLCRSITRDKDEDGGIFRCPVYKAENRGPTFVFSAQVKTKFQPDQWVLAGVGLILDIA